MEELKCPNCKKDYSESNPPRLLTMCGHTYCHLCLKNMIKRKDYRYCVRCPEDRLTLTIDSASPSHFPRNMILLDAVLKQHARQEAVEEKNEFMPLKETCNSNMRGSYLGCRRLSLEEGYCLLHQKPLDIICMQDKIHICAECALFGLHKGHCFTTIKDLEQKRSEWVHAVSSLIEEKKNLETKFVAHEFEKEISALLTKKKEHLFLETNIFYSKLKRKIEESESKMKKDIEFRLSEMEKELVGHLLIDPSIEEDFEKWFRKVEEKMVHLEGEDVINSLNLFPDCSQQDQEDLIETGKSLVGKMSSQTMKLWSNIQVIVQFPKIQLNQSILASISNSINLLVSPPLQTPRKEQCELQITAHDQKQFSSIKRPLSPILDEVSLLDMSANFKDVGNSTVRQPDECEISIIMSSLQESTKPVVYEQQSQIVYPKPLKRVRSRELTINMTLNNSSQKSIVFNSPKMKKNTEIVSRTNFASPTAGKNKLKKLIFKVKEPEKFDKIINALEKDSLENADLTGLEMGDQIAREFCLKVTESKKLRMLRLMKNFLSDDCSKEVAMTIRTVQILNLAQNSFGDRILESLLTVAQQGNLGKPRSVQLGQNKINPRKHKQKIDELRRLGVTITL